ncbi:phosphotransferase family protein [Haloglomus irregulare]|jgi:aminoglycoside phosphotransferase (APT) family kinase protein
MGMTEAAELVDQTALAEFCREELGGGSGAELSVTYHGDGLSNETLFVDWGDHELVLRRPPAGAHDEGAHDVLREARVMDAVAGEVPVPAVAATCDDPELIGSEFVLLERLDGDVLRTTEPGRFATADARRAVGERLVDTLAEVHAVDYEAVGLHEGEFGYPAGYLERQVETFRQQLEEWLLPMTEHDRQVPHIRAVGEWLAENVPDEADHTLVHGDYKLDNVMFAPGTPPSVAGVLDWELATLGDPLADLGWMLVFWRDGGARSAPGRASGERGVEDPGERHRCERNDPRAAGDPEPVLPEGLVPTFMQQSDYHSRRELVARYEERTGREFRNERFYRGLAAYKITATCEAMYFRYRSGDADDPLYPALEEGVPALARRARRIVDGEEPL